MDTILQIHILFIPQYVLFWWQYSGCIEFLSWQTKKAWNKITFFKISKLHLNLLRILSREWADHSGFIWQINTRNQKQLEWLFLLHNYWKCLKKKVHNCHIFNILKFACIYKVSWSDLSKAYTGYQHERGRGIRIKRLPEYYPFFLCSCGNINSLLSFA